MTTHQTTKRLGPDHSPNTSIWPRCGGFTLVEVLVTLAIMGLVMLGLQVTLQSTMYTHDAMAVDMAKLREGPTILDMIERDLRGLYCFNIKDKKVLRGESETHAGSRGDRLDFLTSRDSGRRIVDPHSPSGRRRMIASDITEIGYRLRLVPDMGVGVEPLMELCRREDLFVDDKPMEGGSYEILHDRVLSCEIRYIPKLGVEGDEEDDWDVSEKKKLPAAIEVTLSLMPHSKAINSAFADHQESQRRRTVHRRYIILDPSLNRTLAVRPARLVAIDENDTGSGGGGGGGGGGGPGAADGGDGTGGGGGGGDSLGGEGRRGPGGERGGSILDGMGRGGPGGGLDGGPPPGAGDGLLDGIFGLGDGIGDLDGDLLDSWLDESEGRFGEG